MRIKEGELCIHGVALLIRHPSLFNVIGFVMKPFVSSVLFPHCLLCQKLILTMERYCVDLNFLSFSIILKILINHCKHKRTKLIILLLCESLYYTKC